MKWSTIPWTSTWQLNNSKAMVSGKSSKKSTNDLHRHSNYVVGSNELVQWMVLCPSCKLTRTCEQCITVELVWLNFQRLTINSAVVLYVSRMPQFYYSTGLLFIYSLCLKLLMRTVLNSCKVLKRCHLDLKRKFTKVTGNTWRLIFDRPYWSRTLSSTSCTLGITYIVIKVFAR